MAMILVLQPSDTRSMAAANLAMRTVEMRPGSRLVTQDTSVDDTCITPPSHYHHCTVSFEWWMLPHWYLVS